PPATRPPALAETMTKPASAGTAGEPATALDGNVAPTPIPKSPEPSPHARLAAAQRQLARGHPPPAKQAFQQPRRRPERAAEWVGLSRVALAQGASGEAERMARKAVGAGGEPAAHLALGNAYLARHRHGEAAQEFRAVLKAQPDSSEARRGLAAAQRRPA